MSGDSGSTSSSNEELDDELMLRLYTGKMNVESFSKVGDPEENKENTSSTEERETLKRSRDSQDNGYADRNPKRPRRIESAPTTPSRYYGSTVICFTCKKQGHTSQHCSAGRKCIFCALPEHRHECPNHLCSWCNNPGHQNWECKMPKAEKGGCFVCGKDHDPQLCTSIIEQSSQDSFCFNCGAQGHIGQVGTFCCKVLTPQQCQQPTMNDLVSVPLSKVHRLLDVPCAPRRKHSLQQRGRRHSAPAGARKQNKKERVVFIEEERRSKFKKRNGDKRKRTAW